MRDNAKDAQCVQAKKDDEAEDNQQAIAGGDQAGDVDPVDASPGDPSGRKRRSVARKRRYKGRAARIRRFTDAASVGKNQWRPALLACRALAEFVPGPAFGAA